MDMVVGVDVGKEEEVVVVDACLSNNHQHRLVKAEWQEAEKPALFDVTIIQ